MNADPRGRAQAAQRVASDPAVSAFVAASAGSGKTKLLTDRLLRLMLAGAAPGRIQCLTYTKAAAAEMALRLQTMLGRWVTLEEAKLDAALRELDLVPDDALRAKARALFAEVLDLQQKLAFEQKRAKILEAEIEALRRNAAEAAEAAARLDAILAEG